MKNYKPLPVWVTIKNSDIEGLGLFATKDIEAPLELGITHVGHEKFEDGLIRTPLGGFINHSISPNCELVDHLENKYLRIIKDIEEGEELTVTYDIYDPTK